MVSVYFRVIASEGWVSGRDAFNSTGPLPVPQQTLYLDPLSIRCDTSEAAFRQRYAAKVCPYSVTCRGSELLFSPALKNFHF